MASNQTAFESRNIQRFCKTRPLCS